MLSCYSSRFLFESSVSGDSVVEKPHLIRRTTCFDVETLRYSWDYRTLLYCMLRDQGVSPSYTGTDLVNKGV